VGAADAAAPGVAAEPSPDQLAEVAFLTGVGADGHTDAVNFWTWHRDKPATYPGPDSAHKWLGGTAGSPGGVVRYSFDPASNWSPAEEAGWVSAMTLWSAVANISFVAATEPSQTTLTIYRSSDGNSAENDHHSMVPVGSSELGETTSATISVDTSAFGSPNDFDTFGGFGVGNAVHELGHLLGLGHGGPYNAQFDSATQQYGPLDTRLWAIMSYIPATDTSAKYFDQYPVTGTAWGSNTQSFTWMPLDILAAQRLYGKPVSTPLSGGQVFGFNCNVTGPLNQYFNFEIDTKPVVTLGTAARTTRSTCRASTARPPLTWSPGLTRAARA